MARKMRDKEQSHQRIRRSAARLIRKHGVHGVGIQEIMKDAELTVGGFYAHFPTRTAMVKEALDQALKERSEMVANLLAPVVPSERRKTFIEAYLTQDHVSSVETGCAWGALLNEMPRLEADITGYLSERFQKAVGSLSADGAKPKDSAASPHRKAAIATLAVAFACLSLARLHSDQTLQNEILEAGKATVKLLDAHLPELV